MRSFMAKSVVIGLIATTLVTTDARLLLNKQSKHTLLNKQSQHTLLKVDDPPMDQETCNKAVTWNCSMITTSKGSAKEFYRDQDQTLESIAKLSGQDANRLKTDAKKDCTQFKKDCKDKAPSGDFGECGFGEGGKPLGTVSWKQAYANVMQCQGERSCDSS